MVLKRLCAVGFFGVDLFFVLSGFLITGILMRTKEGPGYFRNFYARRVVRIFPLYFLLVGLALLSPLAPSLMPPTATPYPESAHLTVTWPWYVTFASNLMAVLYDIKVHPFLGVAWSLAIEEQFYLVWPLVVLLAPRRALNWVCVGVVAAATMARLAFWLSGCQWVAVYAFTVCRLDALALGALIALRYRPGVAASARVIWAARAGWVLGMAGLVALAVTGLGIATFAEAKGQLYFPLAALTAGCSVILALTASGWLGRVLSNRVLTFFGKYSYAVYLFHPIVLGYLRPHLGNAWIRSLPVPALVGQALFYLIITAVVLLLALLSWRLFESPCLSLKKYFEYESRHAASVRPVAVPQRNAA